MGGRGEFGFGGRHMPTEVGTPGPGDEAEEWGRGMGPGVR